ncbi:MAG: histidinol dehydrogenase, partial [Anaerolineae bacterium]|nr:histidinol dehydrogenase [Anaerolineae bacterium]
EKIVGPGNVYVTAAKMLLRDEAEIDFPAGPSEIAILADGTANPTFIAADVLAQAEHDPLATALLLTPSRELAMAVAAEVERQLARLAGSGTARESLQARGGAVITASVEEAIDLANAYAPEHLCLSLADPWIWVWRVKNAGGIFVGEGSCETLGDYVAGPSHVMPTGGTARFASPLSVADFCRTVSVIALGPEEAQRLALAAARLAHFEGLHAHAAAAEARAGSCPGAGQGARSEGEVHGE